MKKLFTLFAFLACFLGAKAVEVVDAEVDFSKYTDISEVKFYGWGASESAKERLSIQDGCLHFHSEEATDPSWDCQFHPIGGVNAEIGTTYTLHFKIKGSVAQNVSMLGFGLTPYGQFPITTDWVEGTIEYEASSASGDVLMQCGDYVGDWDIAYLKITHDEKPSRPVEWLEQLTNGDAEKSWKELGLDEVKFNDQENNFKVCAWGKVKGVNMSVNDEGNDAWNPFPADIEEEADGNHVFVVHAALADTDGDASAWDNQFWIQSPKSWKEGTQVKLHFRYKASRDGVTTNTQIHKQNPSDYLHWQAVGDVTFTTEWQDFDTTVTFDGSMGGGWSIAFNLNSAVKDATDFYFDDLSWQVMKLDEGLFVASANMNTGLDYDYDNAIEFVADPEDPELMTATVGTAGKEDTWVTDVMISTIRGHAASFRGATIKPTGTLTEWGPYEDASNYKIKLPAAGVWNIYIAPETTEILFEQVEGDAAKEPLNPEDCINETEVIVNAVERAYTLDEAKADGLLVDNDNPTEEEKALYNGQPWDNQFFLIANRTLDVGEEVYLKFEYMAETPAQVGTQNSQDKGGYLHWAGIGNLDFTSEWQTYEKTVAIPSETNGNQNSWTFNLANMKGANKYHFKNFIFMTADKTENLIAKEGTENLWVKEGGNTTAYEFGTDPTGINSVVNNSNVSTATYNLAGQRVSNDYKGLVIKNGKKYIVK